MKMAARGQLRDGPISKFVHNRLDYLCVKFGAFIKKCTIGYLIRPTISSLSPIMVDREIVNIARLIPA